MHMEYIWNKVIITRQPELLGLQKLIDEGRGLGDSQGSIYWAVRTKKPQETASERPFARAWHVSELGLQKFLDFRAWELSLCVELHSQKYARNVCRRDLREAMLHQLTQRKNIVIARGWPIRFLARFYKHSRTWRVFLELRSKDSE